MAQSIYMAGAEGDNGYVRGTGAAYPPAGGTVVPSLAGTVYAGRVYDGAMYYTDVILLRVDSSEIGSGTVDSAYVRVNKASGWSGDGGSVSVEWFDASNWPIDEADWTNTAGTTAFAGTAINSLTDGVDTDLPCSNLSSINKTGYTGLRIHVRQAGTPTTWNDIAFPAYPSASSIRLVVNWTPAGGGGGTPPTGYFVSMGGSDSNPGTLESPFKTIEYAVTVLGAGDTLNIRGGTYLQTARIIVDADGTSEAPIVIQAYPGETVVISGDTNGDGVCQSTDYPNNNRWDEFVRINGDYIHLKNVVICFSGGRGIQLNGSYNWVYGCTVHDCFHTGINDNGGYNVTEACVVYRCVESNYGALRGLEDWGAAISFGGPTNQAAPGLSPYATVKNCTVYHNSGEGIIGIQSDGGTILGNTVWDNWALGMYFDQCGTAVMDSNFIYYTTDTGWWKWADRPAAGILIANEAINGCTRLSRNIVIKNNLVVGASQGLSFWTDAGKVAASGMKDTTIVHNTFVEMQATYNNQVGIQIDSPDTGGSHSGNRVANNVILQTNGSQAYVPTTSGITFDHNNWGRSGGGLVSGTGDVVGDPVLVNPNGARGGGSALPAWYALTASSPGKDAGASDVGVTVDYFGATRPQNSAYDMGFFEYAGTAPAIPAGPTAIQAFSTVTAITVSWVDNASNETGYTLQRARDLGFTSDLTSFSLLANSALYIDTTAVAGVSYYYRVRASNAAGASAWSTLASSIALLDEPAVPPVTGLFGRPTLVFELALSTRPTEAPAWLDVSAYVEGFQTSRGRQSERDPMRTGTATVRLRNTGRRFDPANTTGPYYGSLKRTRRARISASWNGTTYPIFTGFVEYWPQNEGEGLNDYFVDLPLIDGFGILARRRITDSYPSEGTDERVSRVLDASSWTSGTAWVLDSAVNGLLGTTTILGPVGDRSLSEGDSVLIAQDLASVGGKAHLEDVEKSENGRLFVGKDGSMVFQSRSVTYGGTATVATFGGPPRGLELPYAAIAIEDDVVPYNEITVSRSGGTPQTASGTVSQMDHFVSSYEISSYVDNDAECLSAAGWWLARLQDPGPRIAAIELAGQMEPARLWPVILAGEIGERYLVVKRPTTGSEFTQASFVEGIEHMYRALGERWITTWHLSPAGTVNY